jgi:outer membrane lipoprotein carrier protein
MYNWLSRTSFLACACVFATLLFVMPCPSMAATDLPVSASKQLTQSEANSLLVALGKRYREINTLHCFFQQKALTVGRLREGKGEAFFMKPSNGGQVGLMRWEYTEPEPQIIINDGKEVQMYTPADKQLLITSAETANSDITYALFNGKSELTSLFAVSPGDPTFNLASHPVLDEDPAIILTPKMAQSQLKRAQVWLNKDNSIHRLLMEDYFGALTELTFTSLQFDTLKTSENERMKLLKLDLAPGTETLRQ